MQGLGAMGSCTLTQQALPLLKFDLPDDAAAFDALDEIIKEDESWHQETRVPVDYLSARIHRWALDIVLASYTVDPEDKEKVDRMAHERIDEFMQDFFVNPLDRAAYDKIVLGGDGWPWEQWMYQLCRDIFDARSPFDDSPMAEKPPAHLLALKVFAWIQKNFSPAPKPAASTPLSAAVLSSQVVVFPPGLQMAARAPKTAKLEPAKMMRLATLSRKNADVRTSLRIAFSALCEKAWERRMHESVRQDLQAVRLHVDQSFFQMEKRCLEAVNQAKEETRQAKQAVSTMVLEQHQTQESTLRACQERLEFQERTHQDAKQRNEALVAKMSKAQADEIEILRRQTQAAQSASVDARRALEAQVDTLKQTFARDRERQARQLEEVQKERAATAAIAAKTRQETVELKAHVGTSDKKLAEAQQRVKILEERSRENKACIDRLTAENAANRQRLNQMQSAPKQRSRKCVVS